MRYLTKWYAPRPAQPARRSELCLLRLEDRTTPSGGPLPVSFTVVPIGTTPNNITTFQTLDAALAQMPYVGGTITIEPGALALATTPNVDSAPAPVTIQGDPNVPSSILPAINLNINGAAGTSLLNLNLSSVTVAPGTSGFTIARCTVGSITVAGSTTPQPSPGNDIISQNYITGEVSLGPTVPTTHAEVLNNTFVGFSLTMLQLQQNNGTLVKGNTFTGDGGVLITGTPPTAVSNLPQTGISIQSSQNVTIANNVIRLPGNTVAVGASGTYTAIAIGPTTTSTGSPPVVAYGPVSSGSILNNVLYAGTTGTGLYITSQSNETKNADDDTKFQVAGNDFNNDYIGVQYVGSGGGFGTDLGSGNDFHSFYSFGPAYGVAIAVSNFGYDAFLVGTANIYSSPSIPGLDADHGFVQTLYNHFLGRTATFDELDAWAQLLSKSGMSHDAWQSAVVQGIAGSAAALTQVIDGYYLKYLGRQADSSGEQYWVSQVQAGMSLESVQAGFATSQEFISASNTDYVQALYRTFFRRTGSSSELGYWYGQMQQPNGLSIVAQGFVNSQENKSLFVNQFFTDYLHKPASANDLAYWSAQGSLLNIGLGILGSTDYYNRG